MLNLLLTFAARIAWQVNPGMFWASIFWSASFTSLLAWSIPIWIKLIIGLGILSNALAILSNGGFMPVADNEGREFSVWVQLKEHHNFPWLCDVLPLGFSVGDVAIITGLGLFCYWFWFLNKGRFTSLKKEHCT